MERVDFMKNIYTRRLLLRQLEDSDLVDVYRQFSDAEMCRYFSDPPCSIEEAQRIIDVYKYKAGSAQLRFCVVDKVTGDFIGTCGYHFWNKANRRVEIGYDIWKQHWKQGYGKECVAPLLDICFGELKVECVYAYTHINNYASHALLRSLGFNRDGLLRGWINVGGEQQAQLVFTLLKDEWRK